MEFIKFPNPCNPLKRSSRVTPHFRAIFLKNDYMKTTNDFETRFSRMFFFILEL